MEREVAWKKYDEASLDELEALAVDYIDFISENNSKQIKLIELTASVHISNVLLFCFISCLYTTIIEFPHSHSNA